MHSSDQFNPKQFTCDFYKQLLDILSTPELIENARTGFQEKGPDNRYSGKESYNLHLWNDKDAYDFSAAVAQALANTLLKYSDHNAKEPEELLISIQTATDSIKTTKILKLTSNINVEAPLPEIKARLNSRINILQSKNQSLADNPYTMYAIGGALLAGAVALTAIAFSK